MSFKPIFITGIYLILLTAGACVHAQAPVKEAEQLDFAQGLLERGMYDMAILQYQKFITDYPHSSSLQEAYLSLGEGYFLSQEFDKAFDTFNQFKQLFPNSDQLPVSILRLGQVDIQEQKYDEALKELTSINVQKQLKGPMLQSFYFYTAQAYLGKADTVSALAFFQKGAQVQGATDYTAYAFKEIGKIQAQNGQYNDARDAYAKAVSLAGDDSLKGELAYRMAEVDFMSGKYSDAIKGFEQVRGQNPVSDYAQDALANLLLAYFNLGQYDQLLGEYHKDVKEIKDDEAFFPIHYAAVLGLIELKEYDQANALLDRVLAFSNLKPHERAKIFVKKADILIRQKKYKDGLALLDAYSSENIDNADENFFLEAQAYYGLGDFDRAFSFFENVYLNYPGSRFYKAALLGQAHARRQMGRLKESGVLFMKYYELQDQADLKSDALYDAVMTAIKAEDRAEAISRAQEYLKEFPQGEHDGQIVLILADSYDKDNRPQEAVNLLQGYLASTPSPQRPNSVYFLLGFNQQLLGKSDEALASYGKVDQHNEDGAFYPGALKNMAIIYLGQDKEAQARAYFDRLISQAGQNDLQIKTYIWVCNEYLKEQKYDDVLRIAKEAEKHFALQNLLEIKYFEAEALRATGNCDEAAKDYAAVTSSTENNAYTGSAHIGNALCAETIKKFDEARQGLQKALDDNADDYTITVHARFELANLEASQGDLDGAFKSYLLVATIYDDEYYCSESLLRAAKIAEQLKRKADALKMYTEILDKYKNSAAALYAKERAGLLK